ncbi:MAG: pectate lyase [Chitinophagaceae bacterium]|nr:pectate lyase [Chitinophagaceae bacterium]
MTGTLLSCQAQNRSLQSAIIDERPVAFPGAEGFGKYTTGGRGGKVYIVTNLNNEGPGSFREAAEAKETRIIVFAVSGTIHLDRSVIIKGNATIAGHTAPGDGICIADKSVGLGGDNIIIRYMRFRLGDRLQRQRGMVDGSGSEDAFSGSGKKHIIIDHCTFSWSNDECLSVYNGDSTTLQWNIIAEPLNYSYHFEEGDKDWERHGYGGIWGGRHLSAHHNLFAHCNNRNPRFNGIRQVKEELVDYCNNVIYNWGGNNIYAGEGGNYNLSNNYFKYGPSTNKSVRYRIVSPGRTDVIPFGKWYVDGNYVDEAKDVSKNNWLGIHMGNGGTEEDKRNAVISKPHPALLISMQTAEEAFESVMKYAGASFRRDTLDERIIHNVRKRTGSIIDVQGGYPHHSPFEMTVNAWPALRTLPAPVDSDKDGMPDEWEKKNGLDLSDPSDASKLSLDKQYTNIEMYINSLVK